MTNHLQPWSIAAEEFPADGYSSDQLEFLLGYAVLAPSPHNTQPWRFRINATDVELFADRRRALPTADPSHRELVLSCGAALFNLRVAAEYFGHRYKVDLLPDPAQPDLLARFHLGLRGDTSSEDVVLFHAIAQRHTSRQPFRAEPVSDELVRELEAAAQAEGAWLHILLEEPQRMAAADLVAEADRRLWADWHYRTELAKWVRSDSVTSGDGLPLSSLGIHDWLSFAGPLLVRSFNRGNSRAVRDREIAEQSPLLGVLGTGEDDPGSWLAAGQALQNVLLHACSEDLAASFLNQPLGLPELRAQLTDLSRPGYPQALLRFGRSGSAAPTPRRAVRQTLIMHEHAHA
jgi:hypothetical protein